MSPIKPENRARYPKDWKEIRERVLKRAGNRCECIGECGLHHPLWVGDKKEPRRCIEVHTLDAAYAKGKIILTIAHLDHTPENNDPLNLKAMCQRCHLRYDSDHHAKNASATRARKPGQLDFFSEDEGALASKRSRKTFLSRNGRQSRKL